MPPFTAERAEENEIIDMAAGAVMLREAPHLIPAAEPLFSPRPLRWSRRPLRGFSSSDGTNCISPQSALRTQREDRSRRDHASVKPLSCIPETEPLLSASLCVLCGGLVGPYEGSRPLTARTPFHRRARRDRREGMPSRGDHAAGAAAVWTTLRSTHEVKPVLSPRALRPLRWSFPAELRLTAERAEIAEN